MSKVSNYIKQTIAFLKGDENSVIAARNERKADSTLVGQIASLKYQKVQAEIELEEAKDALEKAKFPTTAIANGDDYLNSIKSAQSKVEEREGKLFDIDESINYWEALQHEFSKKVD